MSFMLCLLTLLPALCSHVQPPLREQVDKQLLKQIEALERDYQVKVVLDPKEFPKQKPGSYLIQGRAATLAALHEYLPMFLREWRLYPVSLVKQTKLQYIVLGFDLQLASEKTSRYAIPDYHHDAMFYDVRLSGGSEIYKKYLLEVVHHEFFHFIDFKDDGEVYEDKSWKKLNPTGFKYGKGGNSVQQDAMQGNVTDVIPGFISKYATSGVEEDKAEIFRCMMVNLRELEARAKSDQVLAEKIARMKELLHSLCPEMNEGYWQRLREMERPRLTMRPYDDQWAKDHPTLPPLRSATVATSTAIEYRSALRGRRVTLYDLSQQGFSSVLGYCRSCR